MHSFVHCRASAAATSEAFNPAPRSVGTTINHGWQPAHADTPAQYAQHAVACEGRGQKQSCQLWIYRALHNSPVCLAPA